MARPGHVLVAEHFCTDNESIKESVYQTGRFNKPVYSLSDNEYWSGGKRKPVDYEGILVKWEKVVSSFDNESILWVCRSD